MFRLVLLSLPLIVWALFSAPPAEAQTRILIPCPNGVPCQTTISGHIDAVGAARLPFIVMVSAPAGVCLFVANYLSDGAVIVSIVAPNGIVYRNDGNIVVTPTVAGWYTVQLDTPPPGKEQIFTFAFYFYAASGCTSTPGR